LLAASRTKQKRFITLTSGGSGTTPDHGGVGREDEGADIQVPEVVGTVHWIGNNLHPDVNAVN